MGWGQFAPSEQLQGQVTVLPLSPRPPRRVLQLRGPLGLKKRVGPGAWGACGLNDLKPA